MQALSSDNRRKHAINTLKIRPFKPIKPLEQDADDWLFCFYILQTPKHLNIICSFAKSNDKVKKQGARLS